LLLGQGLDLLHAVGHKEKMGEGQGKCKQ
jgi:hypothetical protein